jgi:molecular chaperone DnaK (HSP70)
VKDCVISVPVYFTDSERRAVLDSAAIAGLNVLKLMNDTTATALAYGIYKQDLPAAEEKARNVVFVDCGHVGIQVILNIIIYGMYCCNNKNQFKVAACCFNKGKLVMQSCSYDRTCGGRNFTEAITRHLGDEIKAKYKVDPFTSPKALLKLTSEVEKLKKQVKYSLIIKIIFKTLSYFVDVC